MTLDLTRSTESYGFAIETKALGQLHIRFVSVKAMIEIEEHIRSMPGESAIDFNRFLLTLLAVSGDDPRSALSQEQAELVTGDELERFAEKFLSHNSWLLEDMKPDNKVEAWNHAGEGGPAQSDLPPGEGESMTKYSQRVLHGYSKRQAARLNSLIAPLRRDAFGFQRLSDATQGMLRGHLRAIDHLKHTFSGTQFTVSPSPLLPESLPSPPMDVPPHPAHETNTILGNVQSEVRRLAETSSESAAVVIHLSELAVSFTSDYARSAKRTARINLAMLLIAVASLLVTAGATVWNLLILREEARTVERVTQGFDAPRSSKSSVPAPISEDAPGVAPVEIRPASPEDSSVHSGPAGQQAEGGISKGEGSEH